MLITLGHRFVKIQHYKVFTFAKDRFSLGKMCFSYLSREEGEDEELIAGAGIEGYKKELI